MTVSAVQTSAVKQWGDLTQRHGDTEKQELHLATKGDLEMGFHPMPRNPVNHQ